MKRRSLPVFLALALLAVTGAVRAADGLTWQTNYEEALKEAKASNKPILVDFTGSDWCMWCIKLSKDTFSKPAFTEYAKKNLVLLELDYPQNVPQSEAIQKQNAELQDKYKIDGFPTIVLLASNGEEIARNEGYMMGGPSGMISWITKESRKK